ncbi:Hypothetical predicted protein [Octopus vulgaris]|uniref:Uncharacterized protein n=1 Tax=Octopus vulgaris TaxID=6645 RepID=A0AA36F4H7_OCTVU|nr:Hypothetical predicted protein [Octopus vulgaris]
MSEKMLFSSCSVHGSVHSNGNSSDVGGVDRVVGIQALNMSWSNSSSSSSSSNNNNKNKKKKQPQQHENQKPKEKPALLPTPPYSQLIKQLYQEMKEHQRPTSQSK